MLDGVYHIIIMYKVCDNIDVGVITDAHDTTFSPKKCYEGNLN